MELVFLGLFSAALLICVILNRSILYALLFGYALFFAYGLIKKRSARQMLLLSLSGVGTVKNILFTFVLIGIITAVWRACGTIPYIIYYASAVCTPAGMLLLTFLLCSLVSFLTGTSFGTAGTVGVICMTMASGMGIPNVYTGGAVLAGAYFGDRCSPMSTSALLICELTGSNIYRNIANMVRTSIVPFVLSCAVYLLLGLLGSATAGGTDVRGVFRSSFQLHPAALIPAAIIIVLSLLRQKVRITMSMSILAAMVVALAVERIPLLSLLKMALFGYHPENLALAALLSGGGVFSMAKVFAVVCLTSCYAGMFRGTGFLNGVKGRIAAVSERLTPFGGVFATAVLTSLIACNQSLTIMMTHQLCEDIAPDGETLACHLENTAVLIPALVPWSIAGIAPLTAAGAPTGSILLACYLYLVPLWNLLRSYQKNRREKAGESNRPGAPY